MVEILSKSKIASAKSDPESKVFERYKALARMIGSMFAPFLEVVVHDLRTPKRSIVAIENGQVTGRKIGDPTTDLGTKRLKSEDIPDELFNYKNLSPKGQQLKSSSLAIRNESGKLIGSFCLNLSCKEFLDLSTILEQLVRTESSRKEAFTSIPGVEEISEAIREHLAKQGLIGRALIPEERASLVQSLKERRFRRVRGAIGIIANELGVTRPSIYNDLKSL